MLIQTRRDFLRTAGLGSLLFSLTGISACQKSRQMPNILLILTDDQGWGDISSHGNEILQTPGMDKIAEEGARLDRFFVSPVCAPTRASLLTGRYHLRSGVNGVTRGKETMRSEEVTIAEILQQNGYATGCFGKWHNGAHYPYHPNGQGFEEFYGFCAGHWNNYFDSTVEHNGEEVEYLGYIADVFTDRALQFIKENKDRPFFCYLPYNPPHSPFQVPEKYFSKYKSKGLEDTLACVYAMCENLDDNIGRILNRLDDLNISENTIVIFITDNGPNTDRYNGNMRGRKGSVHEGGGRVPCFIRWPGKIEAGTKIEKITAHIDILPTLMDLAEIKKYSTLPLDGKSIVPLLQGQSANWPHRLLFTHWGNRGGVRSRQYRLTIENSGIGLFDMIVDPQEKNNLAAEKPEVVRELKAAYDRWFSEVSAAGLDPIPVSIGHPEWPLVTLPGHEAFLETVNDGGISYVGRSGWANDWVTNWTNSDAFPYWEVDVVSAGEYQFTLLYSCPAQDVGASFAIEIAGRKVEGKITEAHDPPFLPSPDRVERKEVYEKDWAILPAGKLSLPEGKTRLVVRALSKPGRQVMELKAVRIRKI